jgi:hypothetical protein
MLLNIFIICSISQFSFGFYQSIDQASDLNENSTLIRNFAIKYDQNPKNLSDTGFPLKFSINIKEFKKRFNLTFQKFVSNRLLKEHSLNVFVLDEARRAPIKHDFSNDDEEFELYEDLNGTSFATLIRNKNSESDPFRLVI